MTYQFVVRVHFEDAEDDPKGFSDLYGPFKSRARAQEFASKIGRRAGLNLNTWGAWAGTDGEDKFAFVNVQRMTSPDAVAGALAVGSIRSWFAVVEE